MTSAAGGRAPSRGEAAGLAAAAAGDPEGCAAAAAAAADGAATYIPVVIGSTGRPLEAAA